MALYKEHTERTIMVILLFSWRDVTNSGPLKLFYQSALHFTNPTRMYIIACHLQLLFYIWEVKNSLILVATQYLPIPISSHGPQSPPQIWCAKCLYYFKREYYSQVQMYLSHSVRE
jgi:hypothetical protein